MIQPDFINMITKLRDKTESKELNWEETSSPNMFVSHFTNYSVAIEQYTYKSDSVDKDRYNVFLLDQEGRTIESVSALDLDNALKYYKNNSEANPGFLELLAATLSRPGHEILKTIFSEARRSALGVNTAIATILRELDEPEGNQLLLPNLDDHDDSPET